MKLLFEQNVDVALKTNFNNYFLSYALFPYHSLFCLQKRKLFHLKRQKQNRIPLDFYYDFEE